MTTYTDKQLAEQIRSGNTKAYRMVYEAYSRRVMGFALTLTKERAEAEDLTQETFIAAFRGRAAFRQKSRLIAWILGICLRRWRDKNRHRSPTLVSIEDDEFNSTEMSHGNLLEGAVIGRLMLLSALDKLSEAEQQTVILISTHGLTYQEVAAEMDEPIGTVKWRFSAAMRKLRKLLLEYECESINRCAEVRHGL